MAWVYMESTGLGMWDGSDADFPRINRYQGAPQRVFPAYNACYFNPGTLGDTTARAATDSIPLDGVSHGLTWLTEGEEKYLLKGMVRREEQRQLRRISHGHWLFSMTAKDGKLELTWQQTGYPRLAFDFSNESIFDPKDGWSTELPTLHNIRMLERRFSWSVCFRRSKEHIRVGIASDAHGIRALLRDREKNGTRRSPLLHWVQEHARRNRVDEEATHEVRAHLRGKRICDWRGYLVEIRESELEREKELEQKGTV